MAPNTEGFLEIGGEKRPVKMGNRAVRSLCQLLDERFVPLVGRFGATNVDVEDVATVLHQALLAGGNDVTLDQVIDWMDDQPFDHWFTQANDLLLRIMQSGNAKAPRGQSKSKTTSRGAN